MVGFAIAGSVQRKPDGVCNGSETAFVGDLTPEQRRNNGRKTVLIVEDNELNMRLFHDIMEMQGYNIIQTTNGMDALKLTRRHRPDLIVMDIQLPEVSGLEVTRWIKEDDNLRSTPIIAVTAFALKGDESRILQSGCEAYLAKPISIDQFLETVESFMG
jgi:two-component system cell cycle response regulator DivK